MEAIRPTHSSSPPYSPIDDELNQGLVQLLHWTLVIKLAINHTKHADFRDAKGRHTLGVEGSPLNCNSALGIRASFSPANLAQYNTRWEKATTPKTGMSGNEHGPFSPCGCCRSGT